MRASTVSALFLSTLITPSLQSPVAQPQSDGEKTPINPPVIGHSKREPSLLGRKEDVCCELWVEEAEDLANLIPNRPVKQLCSSYLSKYTTVTKTAYTKTATPTSIVGKVTTAPQPVVTATVTVFDTQTLTDEEDVTVTTVETDSFTETDTVATATITLGPPARLRRNEPDLCWEISQLVHIEEKALDIFCSCYASGPTHTVTVTHKAISTAARVTVTEVTATVQPATSTATAFVTDTNTVTDAITSTIVVTATTDVTSTVDATATATASAYLQVNIPGSSYDGLYGWIDAGETQYTGHPLQFTADLSQAYLFLIDDNGHLDIPSLGWTAEQNAYSTSDSAGTNALFLDPVFNLGSLPQPSCAAPGDQLTCAQEGSGDPRAVLSICPSIAAYYPGIYADTPFVALDAGVDDGCELAIIDFIYQ